MTPEYLKEYAVCFTEAIAEECRERNDNETDFKEDCLETLETSKQYPTFQQFAAEINDLDEETASELWNLFDLEVEKNIEEVWRTDRVLAVDEFMLQIRKYH